MVKVPRSRGATLLKGKQMIHSTQFDLPGSVSVELHDDIALLCLSRPEKRNAIDNAMVDGIDRFFSGLPAGIRAVVIHGKGDHFSAGLDLSSITDIDGSAILFGSRAWHRVFDRIEYGEAPVVAVLHGAVVGGGLELAAAAHIRLRSAGLSMPCRRAAAVSSLVVVPRCGSRG
jgi:(methylthio)acryloyl-CoA hydratase